MKDVLDSQHNGWVVEVFKSWMEGHLPEKAIRDALGASGEMDRWDTIRLRAPEQRRLADAMDAVTDLLNSTAPSRPVTELTQANGLLRQVMDCLREVNKT